MNISTRLTLAVISIAVAAVAPFSVSAAGVTVLVEQTKTGADFGTYTLSGPAVTKTGNAEGGSFSELPAGDYTLSIKPPLGSRSRLEVYRGPVKIADTTDRTYSITIAEGQDVKFAISYMHLGTVTIESDPEGVSFSLSFPNGTSKSGTTPARFDMLNEGVYTVFYDTKKECEAQKSQERPLTAGGEISFYAVLNCGTRKISTPGKTNKPLATGREVPVAPAPASSTASPALRIVQESNMTEAVPGSKVRITLTVRNVSRETLHDLHISDAFDPAMFSPVLPVPQGGSVIGNALVWNVSELFAGQSWNVTFEMTISDSVKNGDRGVLKASAESPDIDAHYTAPVGGTLAIGIAAIPQTGNTMDSTLILAAAAGAAILGYFTNRRSGFQALTASN
ncbi:hypothetical protein FJZ28_01425 [Candidatus Peregrinibacteria bacterium]|nr:hypothetical protein [Candidatus Peregrinibacteria bacterium]